MNNIRMFTVTKPILDAIAAKSPDELTKVDSWALMGMMEHCNRMSECLHVADDSTFPLQNVLKDDLIEFDKHIEAIGILLNKVEQITDGC